ncbi:MAG: hypothetical protein DWQ40_12090 [Actinobacteria bacterium]|nr:MAG: hypothetical protein DWQ40_12090 [Actinomycetota bacterium]REK38750.1 MAG: hypothetical protein DWQ20_03500 [Actinomycetota bacterium]
MTAAASATLNDLLGLEFEPVAITFLDETSSNGVPRFDAPMSEPTEDGRSGRAAAPCVFWIHGHESTFDTMVEDHGNCSVGLFTHGFAGAEDIIDKSDVGALLDVGWVTMEAFAGVEALNRRPAGVRYGPLSEASSEPDVVLLRITPKQMMAINDAVEVEWSGKPQCQILPRAANKGVIAASMGCALSRARTGMGDDELTVAVPGSRVDELVVALQSVRNADSAVVGYATADMERF